MRLLLSIFFILASANAHCFDRCDDIFRPDEKVARAISDWESEIDLAIDEKYDFDLVPDGDSFLFQIRGGSTRFGRIASAMDRNYGAKLYLDRKLPFGHGLVTFDGNMRLSNMALATFELHLPVLIHEAVHMKLQSRVLDREIDLPLVVMFHGEKTFKRKGYESFFRADESRANLKGARVAKRLKLQMPLVSVERFILWSDERDQRKASAYFTRESLRMIERALKEFDQLKDSFEFSKHAIGVTLPRAGRLGRPVIVAVPYDLSKVDDVFMEKNKESFLSVIHAHLVITRAELLRIQSQAELNR